MTYSRPSDFDLPSPPYYRPASTVTLTCTAHHAVGSVSYRWSSTCGSSCFASSSTSQSVSKSILQSIDAGVHTCRATDSLGNTGSNATEMILIGKVKSSNLCFYMYNAGSGIYVQRSRYIRSSAVANNSLIVRGSSSSYYIDAQCYSNSTLGSTAYFRFPDGSREYSDSNENYYRIEQLSYTGVRISRYSSRYNPNIYGIFTCEVPDSRGITIETSIGIYSSRPSEFTNVHIYLLLLQYRCTICIQH